MTHFESSHLHFIGLPARAASFENSHGFANFEPLLLVDLEFLSQDFVWFKPVKVTLFVGNFWLCDTEIKTIPATKQPTPMKTITPAKI